MLVLGIDPGTANTGYGVVRGDGRGVPALVECGVIRTRARDPLPARLREIFSGVQELIGRHRPDALSVEDVFYARNVRTTVVLGHARGVILLAAELANVPVTGSDVESLLKLIEALEDLDDVQKVWGNFEIDDDELARLEG